MVQMESLTEKEIEMAFKRWRIITRNVEIDSELLPFLNDRLQKTQPGVLRRARMSLLLSAENLAAKLSMTKSGYFKLEKSEQTGTITIASLAKLAEAMDCELIYALRPKSQISYSEIIWKKLLSHCLKHPWLKACDPKKKADALLALAIKAMMSSNFRKAQGWSQHKYKPYE